MAADSSISATTAQTDANSPPVDTESVSKGVGGRSLKLRKDGVAYTDVNKMIAVHYAFSNVKKRKLEESIEDLSCGKTALYRWKKLFPVAAGAVAAEPGSALAKVMDAIRGRTDADNLKVFRQPTFSGSASIIAGATSLLTSSSSSSSTRSTGLSDFSRPDGLGPQAEDQAASGVQPGMLPAILASALRRIEDARPVSDEELRKVGVSMDDDVETSACAFVEESVGLGVRLKDQNLKDSTKALWVPHQKHFIAWWRALNRLRATSDKEGWAAESADVLVTEQKLLTWLNCYVLYRNPTLVYESVRTHVKAIKNLWEFQVALKKNLHPAPDGHLVSQYLKAISLSRAAQSRARGDDKFVNTLKDGYDRQGHIDMSRWFLLQACDNRRQFAAIRDRFGFLWQHAIMGRSEDLRDRELSDFYACEKMFCPKKLRPAAFLSRSTELRHPALMSLRPKTPSGSVFWPEIAGVLSRRCKTPAEEPEFVNILTDNAEDYTTSVSYDTQAALLKEGFAACAITSSAVTHAMRKGGSRFAYEASCTEDAVRKHGRWCGDRMMERYLTGVSLQPVRALAGFQKDGGDYWLPRAMLEPPQELARMIFPWVESKEQDIKKRLLHGGESDAAALEFLAMLKFLRVVLLQDMAMLQETNTMLPLFTTAPFNTHAFSAWKEALKAKINSTPTPFEMSLESLMPAVCHALAAVRSAVEEIRTIISSATAELKAQVQALEIKSEERHGEVMGAVGAMLLMGQGGSKRNDTQAKAVQSLLVDGIKTVMSLIQQIQQISLNAELEPTSSITFNSSAGVAINTSSNLPSSELVVRSSSSPPGQHLASSPLPPQHQQQLQQMLHALQNVNTSASAPASASTTSAQSSGSSSAHVPCFSLPVVRNAVELWDEWSVGREGRDALEQIRIADESKHEEDRTFARRLASSAAIKQQVYRWSKVVAFIKERVEEDGVEGRVVARQLDEHIRRSRGKLLSPLRTMADLLLTDSGRDGLKRGILPSTPSAST